MRGGRQLGLLGTAGRKVPRQVIGQISANFLRGCVPSEGEGGGGGQKKTGLNGGTPGRRSG